MTTDRQDSAAEWKRASGVWHYWAETHWSEQDSNPFRPRKTSDDAAPADDNQLSAEEQQKHTL